MTAVRPAGLESFLRKPDPAIAAILIYGEEPDAVRDLARRAVRAFAGSADDPFAVTALADQDLGSDPARLADEVQSVSLFGGRRAISVRPAGEGFLKAAAPLLSGGIRGNLVVAEAGTLGKSSQLRAQFEKSPHALIVPLYEAEPGELAQIVDGVLGDAGLHIGPDAVSRLLELSGSARGLVRREAEKLALYCLGQPRVSLADVEAVCGNDTGASPDDLADSVFSGEAEAADRLFHDLVRGGDDPGRLLSAVHQQALRLQDFRLAIDRGAPAEQVLRQARPPVFFKRQGLVQTQLRMWSLADLVFAGATLGAGVAAARRTAVLAGPIANRCLLSLARKGQSLRHGR